MSFRTVAAGRGVEWVTEGAKRILAKPEVFGVMALIIAAIGIIPGASVILGPALLGGLMYAIREHEAGRPVEIGQLFTAFQQPGKIGPMLMLCLPGIVLGVVMAILVAFMIFGVAASGGRGGIFGVGMLFIGIIGLALAIGVMLATFFAVPRVMLDEVAPIDAMKESVSAGLANIGALILFFVLVVVGAFVLGCIAVFIPVIGPLALATALNAIVGGSVYTAYLDVYGASASAPPSFPPPMGPPSSDAPPPPPAPM